jgi:hypothetical protein
MKGVLMIEVYIYIYILYVFMYCGIGYECIFAGSARIVMMNNANRGRTLLA